MAAKKLAISLPEDVLAQVDRAAADRGLTRSGFIAQVLRQVARARGDAQVTARLNRLFGDPEVADEQSRTARGFRAAAPAQGWDW